MKKVVMTVIGVLVFAASANAQVLSTEYGSWYTDRAEWLPLVTNVRTADYTYTTSSTTSITENDITATTTGTGRLQTSGTYLLTNVNNVPITFTFTGNAFSGQFGTFSPGSIDFSIDGSLTNFYNLTPTVSSSASPKFLGYISKSSSSIINVKLTPRISSGGNILKVHSFSSGASVAPEPGTLALALTGGCALVGMFIRRRRKAN